MAGLAAARMSVNHLLTLFFPATSIGEFVRGAAITYMYFIVSKVY